jgi:hypothetical protein
MAGASSIRFLRTPIRVLAAGLDGSGWEISASREFAANTQAAFFMPLKVCTLPGLSRIRIIRALESSPFLRFTFTSVLSKEVPGKGR